MITCMHRPKSFRMKVSTISPMTQVSLLRTFLFSEGQSFLTFRGTFFNVQSKLHYSNPISLVKILRQDTAMVGDRTPATSNAPFKDWESTALSTELNRPPKKYPNLPILFGGKINTEKIFISFQSSIH